MENELNILKSLSAQNYKIFEKNDEKSKQLIKQKLEHLL